MLSRFLSRRQIQTGYFYCKGGSNWKDIYTITAAFHLSAEGPRPCDSNCCNSAGQTTTTGASSFSSPSRIVVLGQIVALLAAAAQPYLIASGRVRWEGRWTLKSRKGRAKKSEEAHTLMYEWRYKKKQFYTAYPLLTPQWNFSNMHENRTKSADTTLAPPS